MTILQEKIKIQNTIWSSNPNQSRDLNRYLSIRIYSSITHNSQKVERTQVSSDEWMDKHNMIYMCHRLLFSLKKEWNSDTCYNRGEPWRHYVNWKKPVTKGQVLCDSISFRQTKWNSGYQGLEERGMGFIAEYEISVWVDEKVLEIDSGDGCTTI